MPRASLTRAQVVADAIALADAEGLDAVSMRRLSQRLGVVPMALYKHVADKEDLLDAMVEAIIGSYDVTTRSGRVSWREQVTDRVLAARSALGRHPWARRAIESRSLRTAAVLGHMEALTSALLAGGFTPDLAHHVLHALSNRIWGFSPELFPGEPAAVDPADYPGIVAVATDAGARRPGQGCDEDFEFRFALDLILDGADRLRRRRWES